MRRKILRGNPRGRATVPIAERSGARRRPRAGAARREGGSAAAGGRPPDLSGGGTISNTRGR
ncbi:MAG: hypothetical protein FJX76_25395 [Armatimonadetes bacterium]|nr:hypothetical protein [Armatimonadota bacterium]